MMVRCITIYTNNLWCREVVFIKNDNNDMNLLNLISERHKATKATKT